MNWLLIAVAAVLILSAFVGHQKGMLRIVFSFGSLLIALIVSCLAAPSVTAFLKDKTGIYEWVEEKSMQFVRREEAPAQDEEIKTGTADASEGASAYDAEAASETAQEGDIQRIVSSITDGLSLPEALQRRIDQAAAEVELAEETTVAQIETRIGIKLAELALSAIGFIVTLLIVRLLLWIVYMALDMVSRLPVIHGLNQTIGMVLGFAEGLLLVWVFFILLTCIIQTQFGQQCLKMISDSRILSALYEYNVLRLFV